MYTGVSDWGSDAMVYSAAVCAVEVSMPLAWRRRAPSMEPAIGLELELELAIGAGAGASERSMVAMYALNGCVNVCATSHLMMRCRIMHRIHVVPANLWWWCGGGQQQVAGVHLGEVRWCHSMRTRCCAW